MDWFVGIAVVNCRVGCGDVVLSDLVCSLSTGLVNIGEEMRVKL